jgi:hypothetical protein
MTEQDRPHNSTQGKETQQNVPEWMKTIASGGVQNGAKLRRGEGFQNAPGMIKSVSDEQIEQGIIPLYAPIDPQQTPEDQR